MIASTESAWQRVVRDILSGARGVDAVEELLRQVKESRRKNEELGAGDAPEEGGAQGAARCGGICKTGGGPGSERRARRSRGDAGARARTESSRGDRGGVSASERAAALLGSGARVGARAQLFACPFAID